MIKVVKKFFKIDIHKIALIKLQLYIASLNNIAAASVCNLNLFDFTVVLYVSFDKFILAVESRDLSQADKSMSSFPKLFLNDKIYSYTKKTIWHLAIWQN